MIDIVQTGHQTISHGTANTRGEEIMVKSETRPDIETLFPKSEPDTILLRQNDTLKS